MNKSWRIIILFVLVMVLILSFTACNSGDGANEGDENGMKAQEETAKSFVTDLVNENYEEVYNNYDYSEEMKNAVSVDFYRQIMEQLNSTLGSFKGIEKTNRAAQGGYDIIVVTCEFENNNINMNVVFNQENKIGGFNISNPEDTDNIGSEDRPDNVEEYEVVIGNSAWELPGTLTLPKGTDKVPVVVLVHGSGPNDRDETIGPNKPFRDIAWGLAAEGIGVLRYDKRTNVHMERMQSMMEEITVKEEVIEDVMDAVHLLQDHERIDGENIYVLGHSMGGYLLPKIGMQNEEVSGFIILAGSTRPMEDLIVEQVEYIAYLDGELSKEEEAQIASLNEARQNIKNLDEDSNPGAQNLMGINAKYWLDLKNYNPTEVAQEIDRPILVLQGERDYQVTMVDFQNWKKALENKEKVDFKSFPNLNHIFIEGEGKSTPQEYSVKGNVSEEVIDYISRWIKGQN